MSDFPSSISIKEEGPREGFQFEKGNIPSDRKIALIDSLSQTGLKQIQIVSFVPARNVPGMADADEVVRGFTRAPGVSYTSLWLNERGLERALGHADKLDIKGTLTLTASEKFLLRNQKRTIAQNIAEVRELAATYKKHGVKVERISVAAAFGCNFEGDIPVDTVLGQVAILLDIAREHGFTIRQLSLADTMAWATPMGIKRLVGAVRARHPDIPVSLHLHDTRGMGIANAYAGLELGVGMFDAAVGGLGGCPFAAHKGAAGNVCTEDLVFMCDEMGIPSGVDLEALLESARLAEEVVGHPLPGAVKTGGSLRTLRSRMAQGAAA